MDSAPVLLDWVIKGGGAHPSLLLGQGSETAVTDDPTREVCQFVAMFSMKIVTTDYYLCAPLLGFDPCISEFRGNEVKKVPVFRIYGSTPKGQKTCLHLHGVFPYLYVPHDGTPPVDHYLKQFASAIDKALNISLGNGQSTTQHVYKISFVSGIPFYGYHHREENFLKIYLYNPSMVKRVAELLLGGAVMNKVYQPHESHVPYSLQLFMDYNLYGMTMIDVAAVKFRRPKQEDVSTPEFRFLSAQSSSQTGFTTFDISQQKPDLWTIDTIQTNMWMDEKVARMSTCELEVDAVAADILNRLQIEGGSQSNPGLLALWDDERRRRNDQGLPLDTMETTSIKERRNVLPMESEQRWNERLSRIIPELSQRVGLDRSLSESLSLGSKRLESQIDQSSMSLDDSMMSQARNDEDDALLAEILESLQQERGPLSQTDRSILPSTQHAMDEMEQSIPLVLSQESRATSRLLDRSILGRSLSRQALVECIREYEEQDSVLATQIVLDKDQEEKDNLEMSQCIWNIDDDDLRKMLESESFTGGRSEGRTNLPQADGTNDESVQPRLPKQVEKRPTSRDHPLSTPSVSSEASVSNGHWYGPQNALLPHNGVPPLCDVMHNRTNPAHNRTSMLRLLNSDSNSPIRELMAYERDMMQNGATPQSGDHSSDGNSLQNTENISRSFAGIGQLNGRTSANEDSSSDHVIEYSSKRIMTAGEVANNPMISKYNRAVNRSVTSSLTVDTGNPDGIPRQPEDWANPLTPVSPWTDPEQRVPWIPPPPPWSNNPRCQWSPLTPRSMSNPQTPGTVTSPNSPWDPGSDWNSEKSPNWGPYDQAQGSPQVPDATQIRRQHEIPGPASGASPMHNQRNYSLTSRVVINRAMKRHIPHKNISVPEPPARSSVVKKSEFFNPNPGQFDAWTARPPGAQRRDCTNEESTHSARNMRSFPHHNSVDESNSEHRQENDIYGTYCETPMPPSVGSLLPGDDFHPGTPSSVCDEPKPVRETAYPGARPSGQFRQKPTRPSRSPDRYSPDYYVNYREPGRKILGIGRRKRESSKSPAAINRSFMSPRNAVLETVNLDDLRDEPPKAKTPGLSKKEVAKEPLEEPAQTHLPKYVTPSKNGAFKAAKMVINSPRQVTVDQRIVETYTSKDGTSFVPKKFQSTKKTVRPRKKAGLDSDGSADEWNPSKKTKTKSPRTKRKAKSKVYSETISNGSSDAAEDADCPSSLVSVRRRTVQRSFNDLIEHLKEESYTEKPWFKSFSLMDSIPPSPSSSEDLPDLPFVSSNSEKIDFTNIPKKPEIKVSIDLRKLSDKADLYKKQKNSETTVEAFCSSSSANSTFGLSNKDGSSPMYSKKYTQVFRPADVVWFTCKPMLCNSVGKITRCFNPHMRFGKRVLVKVLAADKRLYDFDKIGNELVRIERMNKSAVKNYRKLLKKNRRGSPEEGSVEYCKYDIETSEEVVTNALRMECPTRGRKRSKEWRQEKMSGSISPDRKSDVSARRRGSRDSTGSVRHGSIESRDASPMSSSRKPSRSRDRSKRSETAQSEKMREATDVAEEPDVYVDIASVGSAIGEPSEEGVPKLCVRLEHFEEKLGDVFSENKANRVAKGQYNACVEGEVQMKSKVKSRQTALKNLFELLSNPSLSNPSSRDSPVAQLSNLAKLYKDIAGKMNSILDRPVNAKALADLSEFSFDRGQQGQQHMSECYGDQVADHNFTYEDVLNVFALLSPVSDRSSIGSPPLPYSPQQMMLEMDINYCGTVEPEERDVVDNEASEDKVNNQELQRRESVAPPVMEFGGPAMSDDLPDLGPPLTAPVSPCSRSTSPPSLSDHGETEPRPVNVTNDDVTGGDCNDATEVCVTNSAIGDDFIEEETEFRNVKSVESDLLKNCRLMETRELVELVQEPEDIRSPLPCKIAGVACTRAPCTSTSVTFDEKVSTSRVYSTTHSESSLTSRSSRIAYKRFSVRSSKTDDEESTSGSEDDENAKIRAEAERSDNEAVSSIEPKDFGKANRDTKVDHIMRGSSHGRKRNDDIRRFPEKRHMTKGSRKKSPLSERKQLESKRRSSVVVEDLSEKEKLDRVKPTDRFLSYCQSQPTFVRSEDALASAIASISPPQDSASSGSTSLDSEATIITDFVEAKIDLGRTKEDIISNENNVVRTEAAFDVATVGNNVTKVDNGPVTDVKAPDKAIVSKDVVPPDFAELERDVQSVEEAENDVSTEKAVTNEVVSEEAITKRCLSPEMLGTPDSIRSRSPCAERRVTSAESYPYLLSVSDFNMPTPIYVCDYTKSGSSWSKQETLAANTNETLKSVHSKLETIQYQPKRVVQEMNDQEGRDEIEDALGKPLDSDSESDEEVHKGREALDWNPFWSPRTKAAQIARKLRLRKFLATQKTFTESLSSSPERIIAYTKNEERVAPDTSVNNEPGLADHSQELLDVNMESGNVKIVPETTDEGPMIDETDDGIDAVEMSPEAAIQQQIDETMDHLSALSRSSAEASPREYEVVSPNNLTSSSTRRVTESAEESNSQASSGQSSLFNIEALNKEQQQKFLSYEDICKQNKDTSEQDRLSVVSVASDDSDNTSSSSSSDDWDMGPSIEKLKQEVTPPDRPMSESSTDPPTPPLQIVMSPLQTVTSLQVTPTEAPQALIPETSLTQSTVSPYQRKRSRVEVMEEEFRLPDDITGEVVPFMPQQPTVSPQNRQNIVTTDLGLDLLQAAITATELLVPGSPDENAPRDPEKENPLLFKLLEQGDSANIRESDNYRSPFGLEDLVSEKTTGVRPKSSLEKVREMRETVSTLETMKVEAQSPIQGIQLSLPETAGIDYPDIMDSEFGTVATVATAVPEGCVVSTVAGTVIPTVGVFETGMRPGSSSLVTIATQGYSVDTTKRGVATDATFRPVCSDSVLASGFIETNAIASLGVSNPQSSSAAQEIDNTRATVSVAGGTNVIVTNATNMSTNSNLLLAASTSSAMQSDFSFLDVTDHIPVNSSHAITSVTHTMATLSPSLLSDHESRNYTFDQNSTTNQMSTYYQSSNQLSEDEMRSLCLETSSNSSASPSNFEIPSTLPFQPSIYKDMVNDSSSEEAPSIDRSGKCPPYYSLTRNGEQQVNNSSQENLVQLQQQQVQLYQQVCTTGMTSSGHVTNIASHDVSPPLDVQPPFSSVKRVLTPVVEPPARRKVRVELRRMGIVQEKAAFSGLKPGQDSMRVTRAFESARRAEITELHQWKAVFATPGSSQTGCRVMVLTPCSLPPSASKVNEWTMKTQSPDDFHTRIPSQPLVRHETPCVLECDSTTVRSDGESRSPMSDRSEPSPSVRSGRGSPPSKTRRVETFDDLPPSLGSQSVQTIPSTPQTYPPVESNHLTVFSLEVLCEARGELKPDPEHDAILAAAYTVSFGEERKLSDSRYGDRISGVIMVTTAAVGLQERWSRDLKARKLEVVHVADERQLLTTVEMLVNFHDPDILVGYEIQMASWGYIIERSKYLDMDMTARISRLPEAASDSSVDKEKDEYSADHMSEFKIAGRVVLNLWRVLRHELTLNIYTFENVVHHVLHRRLPVYSCRRLADWFLSQDLANRWRSLDYIGVRASGCVEIMENIDLLEQTSEFARVFGIEFYHVLSRGTQYRVEAMMLRMTKNQNYIAVSPSIMQRARQAASETMPLTLEPESSVYTEPVVVLDFQSLYPSIMIAYNYCFSTCLGKVDNIAKLDDGPYSFGCTSLDIDPEILKKLERERSYTISPIGAVFVKSRVRKGVLPRMMEDILNTRFMVKKSMKRYKTDKRLTKILHARQLSLKLIANVTYGYTAANFSGRMPCMEVGDSVVSKARETLERAIAMVNDNQEWDAKVVYGDTDSLFILLPGRTKDEAFAIGQEMCDAITSANPSPIKLRFEKVYLPCVLQTKKRYAGYMYETPEQEAPVLDAKGIETIRRDNCPVVSKTLDQSIKCLFTTRDVAQVKSLVQKVCCDLLDGHTSIQALTFAKEYRGLQGYSAAACVPALEIARRSLSVDRRSEPRVGERVPYVIVYGGSGQPLIQLVRTPMEMLRDRTLRPNAVYYIMKQVLPPLDRIFSIIGVSVFSWFQELPRLTRITSLSCEEDIAPASRQGVLPMYFATKKCIICEDQCSELLCTACKNDTQTTSIQLCNDVRECEMALHNLTEICYNCTGRRTSSVDCVSLDCPVLYKLNATKRRQSDMTHKYTLHAQLLL